MSKKTNGKTSGPPKGRLLTATELKLAEGMSKALIGKATAEATLDVCRHEIARLTQEINRLGLDPETGKTDYRRPGMVWAETRELAGQRLAPTREQLVRR